MPDMGVRALGVRIAVVAGVLAAALMPASHPMAAPKAAHRAAAVKKPAAADQTGTVSRRKAKGRAKAAPSATVMNSYVDMPEAQRLTVQSDLAAGRGPEANAGWRLIEDPARSEERRVGR